MSNWNCLFTSAVAHFLVDNKYFSFPSPPDSSSPASAGSYQGWPKRRGNARRWRHSRFTHFHKLQHWFNPNCRLVAFRLKKICEIYSRVLCSEEALHVSLDTDQYTYLHSYSGTASLVKPFTCPLVCVCVSRCTTRRRTGVRRSTLGAATRPISPRESLPSMASKSYAHTHTF